MVEKQTQTSWQIQLKTLILFSCFSVTALEKNEAVLLEQTDWAVDGKTGRDSGERTSLGWSLYKLEITWPLQDPPRQQKDKWNAICMHSSKSPLSLHFPQPRIPACIYLMKNRSSFPQWKSKKFMGQICFRGKQELHDGHKWRNFLPLGMLSFCPCEVSLWSPLTYLYNIM